MLSMMTTVKKCQAVPDMEHGIVVGVDVSKRKIDFGAFRPEKGTKVYSVKQDATGFSIFRKLLDDLKEQGYQPWIAFEPTGPYSTCFKECLYNSGERIVQVNPYHVKRTKEVRDNSPNKTDNKDPRVIADLVWNGCYQELLNLSGVYAELRAASVEWASLSKKRTALRNEFGCLLEVWFPELASVFKDIACKSARGIVRKYPDAMSIASSRLSSVRSTLKKASSGRTVKKAEEIIAAAKTSIAPDLGQKARHCAMLNLLDMLQGIERRQEQLRNEMNEYLADLPEAKCLLSMPGVGTISVAGLFGECGNIGKFGSYGQLEKFVGLNLYEVSSGRHIGRKHISKRGRALARYLICHMAFGQIRSGGLYDDYAKELKAKGKKTGEIRVAVARKLLRKLYAMARECSMFNTARFFTEAQTEDGLSIQQGTQAKAA